ncbi:MAG: hypothetical protein SH859_11175 [Hyphomicrobium aestuarii]|nr:hypothetical protein [Hyphomicrobium aestuarii]
MVRRSTRDPDRWATSTAVNIKPVFDSGRPRTFYASVSAAPAAAAGIIPIGRR